MKVMDIGNKKIVIYGAGHMLEGYKDKLNWDNIVAVLDKNINKQGKYINQKKIEPPKKLLQLDYDYVAIFTDQHFESVKRDITGNFFVSEEKIVSWRIFFYGNEILSKDSVALYKEYIENKADGAVLDVGEQQIKKAFLTNETLCTIDNLGSPQFPMYRSFYRNFYDKSDEIKTKYEAAFLWEDFEKKIEYEDLICLAEGYIIWTISYGYKLHKNYKKNIDRLEKWGERKTFLFPEIIVYVFEKNRIRKNFNCEILVVMHKEYNVLSDEIYKPICVGSQYENISFYSEQCGENIAYLNDRINECTALYWAWKNMKSEYIGLNHYRRYFYNSEIENTANYLSKDKIIEIFDKGYDIILPKLTVLPVSILSNIINSVGEELADRALQIIYDCLRKRAPKYIEAFKYVMKGNVFYRCQMFIAKRTLFDTYCEWLFPFLTDSAEQLDVTCCDAHHKRTMGYFAETLLSVWLLEQDVKIKELPITNV